MANHVCPWWVGYFLLNPFRKIAQSPQKILGPYIKPGMTVLEVGPGMGFFSLWMARTVGENGKVVCVDIQERMIKALKRRATKAGVNAVIDARVCDERSLGIDDLNSQVDFCLAFAVVHEIADASSLFEQIRHSLKDGATCLLTEPKGHVGKQEFEKTVDLALETGFTLTGKPKVSRSRSVLLTTT